MIYRTALFSMILNDPYPGSKVTQFFNAEYLRNGTRYRHSFNGILIGTYTRPSQQCRFEWLWVILNDLAKYSVTRSVVRFFATAELVFKSGSHIILHCGPKNLSPVLFHCGFYKRWPISIICGTTSIYCCYTTLGKSQLHSINFSNKSSHCCCTKFKKISSFYTQSWCTWA